MSKEERIIIAMLQQHDKIPQQVNLAPKSIRTAPQKLTHKN
jgi:hypothetical protein